jgi:hypothetical protein
MNLFKCLISFAFLSLANPLSSELIEYNFSTKTHGWTGDFADYPVGEESFYELTWGWAPLPSPTDDFTSGLFLSGNNHSDDLFMFVKNKIENLLPDTEYRIVFHATIQNNVPSGLFGVGGSPGESVAVKVGASTEEPNKVEVNGFYKLNVDKGEQMEAGAAAVIVGDLANPSVDSDYPQYAFKEFDNGDSPMIVQTDASGNLWIFFGTDSGFESATTYYIPKITLSINPN